LKIFVITSYRYVVISNLTTNNWQITTSNKRNGHRSTDIDQERGIACYQPRQFLSQQGFVHNDGTNSTVVTTLPNDKKIYVNGQDNSVVNPTDPLRIVMSYFGFNDLNIQLKNTTQSQVFDKLTIDTFDINATNGRNGQYIQFIYKNDYVQPSTPTSSSFPPSGWSTTATTPLDDEYTWMSQRTVTFDNSNNPVYGSWSSPIRISGADGEACKDGDGVEAVLYTGNYILNTKTKKFHYPTCEHVNDISDNNKETIAQNRNFLIEQGYTPCGSCKP
jgi:hypothetical protein